MLGCHRRQAEPAQHAHRGTQVLRLVVAIEGIGEEDHLAGVARRRPDLGVAERVALERRQRTRRGNADRALHQSAEQGAAVAQVAEGGQARGERRVAGQGGHQVVAPGDAVTGGTGGAGLDLHLGHVDADGALAAARLTGYA